MPTRIKVSQRRTHAVFQRRKMASSKLPARPRQPRHPRQPSEPSPRQQQQQQQQANVEEADEEFGVEYTYYPVFMIPDLFTQLPLVQDALVTGTSKVQDETVDACLPFLSGEDSKSEYNIHGVPSLDRESHVKFLERSLGRLPPAFLAADASRPWFLYWGLSALTILDEDVSKYREALVDTARGMQNESGGFGGGGSQTSHLATTYAVVLALALVGGDEAFEVIDRKSLWKWLCALKQPDGGFQVCVGGEEDIRYVNYCPQHVYISP